MFKRPATPALAKFVTPAFEKFITPAFEKFVTPAKAGAQFLALAMLLASCGFALRSDPAVGIKSLHVSTAGPTAVTTDIRRILASGPTRLMATPAGAEAHLRILSEMPEKTVYTITSTGAVYEFQLRLTVRYEVTVPGREEPMIPSTEITTMRVITYSAAAPTAKEFEEQLLFKDMQMDLAGRILRHIAAVKRLA